MVIVFTKKWLHSAYIDNHYATAIAKSRRLIVFSAVPTKFKQYITCSKVR